MSIEPAVPDPPLAHHDANALGAGDDFESSADTDPFLEDLPILLPGQPQIERLCKTLENPALRADLGEQDIHRAEAATVPLDERAFCKSTSAVT